MTTKTKNPPALRGDEDDMMPATMLDSAWRPGLEPGAAVAGALDLLAEGANNAELPVMRLDAAPVHDFDRFPILVMDTRGISVDFTVYEREGEDPSRVLEVAADTPFGERRISCGAYMAGTLSRKAGLRCADLKNPAAPIVGALPDENGVIGEAKPIADQVAAEQIRQLLAQAPTLLVSYEGQREPTAKGRSGMKVYSTRLVGAPPSQVWDAVRAQLKGGR
jgi:hypothetical protein